MDIFEELKKDVDDLIKASEHFIETQKAYAAKLKEINDHLQGKR